MGKCDFPFNDHAYATPSHLHISAHSHIHVQYRSEPRCTYDNSKSLSESVTKNPFKNPTFLFRSSVAFYPISPNTQVKTLLRLWIHFSWLSGRTLGQIVISSSRPYCRIAWLAEVKLPTPLDLCPNECYITSLIINQINHTFYPFKVHTLTTYTCGAYIDLLTRMATWDQIRFKDPSVATNRIPYITSRYVTFFSQCAFFSFCFR